MTKGTDLFVEVKVIGEPAATADREVATRRPATLRALLGELVTLEVSGYEQHRTDARLLHVLTDAQLSAAHLTGQVLAGKRAVPSAPPVAQAVDCAVEAFIDGLFYVFLDGVQIEDLDVPITVGPTSRLRLVRLVALAGG